MSRYLSKYVCDKCGEEVSYLTPQRYIYNCDNVQIKVRTHLCYCYECKCYENAQIGLKQEHILKAIHAIKQKHGFLSQLLNKEVRKTIKCYNELLKMGDTHTACARCGSNAVVLVDRIEGAQHNHECQGRLKNVELEQENSIRFFSGTTYLTPVRRAKYKIPYSEKTAKCESQFYEYYNL